MTKDDIAKVCSELQALQKQRKEYIRFRIKLSNQLQAIIAGTLGYHTGMEEDERKKVYTEAKKLIAKIVKGEAPFNPMVKAVSDSIEPFEQRQEAVEYEMLKLVKPLPVAPWVAHPNQRGFGFIFLAIVIGETGDLSNYANPAKLWRRMGCAPFKNRMGEAHRKGFKSEAEKLSKSEWEEFGYCPRRRSIAYQIGTNIVMQNGRGTAGDAPPGTEAYCAGPYRARYDLVKRRISELHPDDPQYPPIRCHKHGMLLATKLLLKNLWIEWNRQDGDPTLETEESGDGYEDGNPAGREAGRARVGTAAGRGIRQGGAGLVRASRGMAGQGKAIF